MHPEDKLLELGMERKGAGRYVGYTKRGDRFRLEVDLVNPGARHEENFHQVEEVTRGPHGRTGKVVAEASSEREALEDAVQHAKRRRGLPNELDFS